MERLWDGTSVLCTSSKKIAVTCEWAFATIGLVPISTLWDSSDRLVLANDGSWGRWVKRQEALYTERWKSYAFLSREQGQFTEYSYPSVRTIEDKPWNYTAVTIKMTLYSPSLRFNTHKSLPPSHRTRRPATYAILHNLFPLFPHFFLCAISQSNHGILLVHIRSAAPYNDFMLSPRRRKVMRRWRLQRVGLMVAMGMLCCAGWLQISELDLGKIEHEMGEALRDRKKRISYVRVRAFAAIRRLANGRKIRGFKREAWLCKGPRSDLNGQS
jgi:hypothetical protein